MESKYLRFEPVEDGKLRATTELFAVVSKSGQHLLGEVKWFPRWRRYGFFPEEGSVFDATCLQDITAFIDSKMQARGVWRQ